MKPYKCRRCGSTECFERRRPEGGGIHRWCIPCARAADKRRNHAVRAAYKVGLRKQKWAAGLCYRCSKPNDRPGKGLCSRCGALSKKTARECVLRRYGLSLADFDRLLEEQNNSCGLCGHVFDGKRGKIVVDHDHRTGQVRGLLDKNCNSGLGLLGDDTSSVVNALLYLERS